MNDLDHDESTDDLTDEELYARATADLERRQDAAYAAQCERERIEQEEADAKAARNLWKSVPNDALCSPYEAAIIGGISEAELEQRVAAGVLPFPMNKGGFFQRPLECWQQTGMMLGDYRQQAAEQNEIRRFLNNCCRRVEAGRGAAGVLHEAYREWHAETGDGASRFVLDTKRFYRRMTEIGMRQKRLSSGNVWLGIELIPEYLPGEVAPTDDQDFGDFGSPLRLLPPVVTVVTLDRSVPVAALGTGD